MKTKILNKGWIFGLMFCLLLAGITVVSADTHTSSADLQPEWSPAGQNVDYTVTITNYGPDAVDEVRIYRNMQYTNFQCDEKPGWEYNFIVAKQACQYVAENSSYYITAGNNDSFTFSATTPDSGCEWVWEFESRDVTYPATGWIQFLNDTTSVDDLAPNITKTVTGPQSGHCPPGLGDECWITQSTVINISVVEQGVCGVSGLDFCRITYTVDGGVPQLEVYADLDGETSWNYSMSFAEDSVHVLNVTCADIAGNKVEDIETFKVDSTSPNTTKTYGDPHYPPGINSGAPYPHWITTSTPITLTPVDGGNICHIDNVTTYYRNFIVRGPGELACWNSTYCHPEWYGDPDVPFIVYKGPFYKENESCHVIEYYSVDGLGNTEEIKWQCVFVDDTPPNGTKEVGDPKVPCDPGDPSNCTYWVRDHVTEINLTCEDQDPHPVDHEEVCYKVSLDGSDVTNQYCTEPLEAGWCCVDSPKTIIFEEDSVHDLEFYCRDALGNAGEIDGPEYFRVDSQPPIINKTIEGPQVGDCPPEEEQDCWIKDWEYENGTTIHIEAYDNETYVCAVDNVTCDWWYYLNDTYMGGESELTPPFDIKFYEDCEHKLHIKCCDALDNCYEDNETFIVDSTPPETTKTYGEPQKVDSVCVDYCETQCSMLITNLNSGYEQCVEDCKHSLCTWWITSNTPVNLTAEDEKVGVDKIYWRNLYFPENHEICDLSNNMVVPVGAELSRTIVPNFCHPEHYSGLVVNYSKLGWNEYNGSFYKEPESCHVIEYYSVDKLGNEEIMKWQCVFVDNTPPNGTELVGDPSIFVGEAGLDWWVSQDTSIIVDCIDQEPHPVEQETVCFRVSYDEDPDGYVTDEYCEYHNGSMAGDDYCCIYVGDEPFEFHFMEDSVHDLEFYCMDHLGNKEEGDFLEYFKVDTEAPNTTKTYVGPHYVDENGTEWIDGVTEVELTAVDGGEICAVGVNQTYWKNILLDDPKDWHFCYENCTLWAPNPTGGFNVYEGRFNKTEESCHIIEYYSVDDLGNQEDIKWQCVFVDKTPPKIHKDYHGPYFEENGVEWISSETNISLYAYDSEPHPSGLKEFSYRITLVGDGNCTNDSICQEAEGSGGWTTVYTNVTEAKINEQSCHLIEIKAIDNVDKESLHKQCVFVDNTPPTPKKTVGDPKTEWDGQGADYYEIADLCWNGQVDEIECWKVTTMTPIELECNDPEPHPVDHETVCYSVEVDAVDVTEDYCANVTGGTYNETTGYCCMNHTIDKFYFTEETEHNLEYYCVDALGNIGPVDEEKFKVEGISFNITINKKWNLISVPFVMLDDSIDEVFNDTAEDIISVWTYDAGADEWYVYTPGPGADTLSEMKPGWGYWVLAKNDTMLLIGGSLFSPATTPPSKGLVAGWNLIGHYGNEDEWGNPLYSYNGPNLGGDGRPVYCSLYSLLNTFVGYPKWSALVTYWEPDNPNQWKYLNSGNYMNPGAGYWIEMDEEDIYTFSTECWTWT